MQDYDQKKDVMRIIVTNRKFTKLIYVACRKIQRMATMIVVKIQMNFHTAVSAQKMLQFDVETVIWISTVHNVLGNDNYWY